MRRVVGNGDLAQIIVKEVQNEGKNRVVGELQQREEELGNKDADEANLPDLRMERVAQTIDERARHRRKSDQDGRVLGVLELVQGVFLCLEPKHVCIRKDWNSVGQGDDELLWGARCIGRD